MTGKIVVDKFILFRENRAFPLTHFLLGGLGLVTSKFEEVWGTSAATSGVRASAAPGRGLLLHALRVVHARLSHTRREGRTRQLRAQQVGWRR